MLGVGHVVGQQSIDESGSLICVFIGEKRVEFRRGRKQADEVEISPPRERRIVDRLRSRQFLVGQIGIENAVDRIRPTVEGRRERDLARTERRFVRRRAERKILFPFQAFVDPRLEQGDRLGRDALRRRRRHLQVGVGRRDAGQEIALAAFARDDGGTAFAAGQQVGPGVEREAPLLRIARVTLAAVGP